MGGRALLCVGAVLRGDDAAGPYLAKLLEQNPVEGWTVFDGGQMPEDFLSPLRRMRPDTLVVFDAASMELAVGEIRRLTPDDVTTDYLMTTHSLPLSFMLNELKDSCGEIVFIGIQPGHMEFCGPLSAPVLAGVEQFYERLAQGVVDFGDIAYL